MFFLLINLLLHIDWTSSLEPRRLDSSLTLLVQMIEYDNISATFYQTLNIKPKQRYDEKISENKIELKIGRGKNIESQASGETKKPVSFCSQSKLE